MNDILRIARLRIGLQRAFLGRAILIFTKKDDKINAMTTLPKIKDRAATTEPKSMESVGDTAFPPLLLASAKFS